MFLEAHRFELHNKSLTCSCEYFRLKLMSIGGTLGWRWGGSLWWRTRWRSWRTYWQILWIGVNWRRTLSGHNWCCCRWNRGCSGCRCSGGIHVRWAHFSLAKVLVVAVQLIVQLIMELVHFVVFSQMLSYFGVAVFIVCHDYVASIGRGDACLAIVLSW